MVKAPTSKAKMFLWNEETQQPVTEDTVVPIKIVHNVGSNTGECIPEYPYAFGVHVANSNLFVFNGVDEIREDEDAFDYTKRKLKTFKGEE